MNMDQKLALEKLVIVDPRDEYEAVRDLTLTSFGLLEPEAPPSQVSGSPDIPIIVSIIFVVNI
jgi:hypothetical protein